jgi:hypothetical protein
VRCKQVCDARDGDDIHQVIKQLQPADLPEINARRKFFGRTPPEICFLTIDQD